MTVSAQKLMQFDDGPRSKRVAILQAAVESFGSVGYEATKWSTVADGVGIGQTALYHYFESKAHCLLTILRVELERSHQRFEDAIAQVETSKEELRVAVAAAFDVSDLEVQQLRVLQSNFWILANKRKSAAEEAERQGALAMVHEIEVAWQSLLQRGMERKEFAELDLRLTTQIMLGLIVSVWRWYRAGGDVTLGAVNDYVAAACLRLVQDEPS